MLQSHSLMPLLTSPQRLKKAARACMRPGSSPGSDGITWFDYRKNLGDRLEKLASALIDKTWRPKPFKLHRMETITGKRFLITIPTVEDRIVHRAMRSCIEPILEQQAFAEFVFAYRPGRGRLAAVRQGMNYLRENRSWVADADVADASGGAKLDDVMDWLSVWISDGVFLSLVREALKGLPSPLAPGSGLWPLLFNLRLLPADRMLQDLAVVRFADNYCVFTNSYHEAQNAFDLIEETLHTCGLHISPEKSGIKRNVNPEDLFLIAG